MNGNTPIFGNEPRSAKPSNLRIIVSTEEEDRRKATQQ